ncbi:CPBP family intramembrane metalloprotease [Peptoniphilus sp. MSJ-1]|uniref:CPBP family intramembrane metalloprotease n=1 Tax=Peptoniphilus ovalis TaxID=2841503 RepID=A0ABS6FJ46_9FIRM|nr:type II CAAX endopeptidase family protein [Peptoniphilus ovalis]MBU5669225.1 CPBP family intramembrane metalloprotease [Peptoniphilus ovalis]
MKKFFKTLVKIILSVIAIVLLSGLFMMLGSLLFYGKTFFNSNWENANLVMLFGTTGQLLGALFITKYIMKKPLSYIFIKKDNLLKNIFIGLLIGFLQISTFVIIALVLNGFSFKGLDLKNLNLFFIAYFIVFFIQSTSEELLVRGMLTRALLDKYGKNVAIYIPSIFFGLLHLANSGVTFISTFNTILVGIFFAKLLFYKEDIMLCSGAHAGWNFSMAIIYGLPVSGFNGFNSLLNFEILNTNICDKVYGPEGSFIVTLIEVISILIMFYLERKKEKLNG